MKVEVDIELANKYGAVEAILYGFIKQKCNDEGRDFLGYKFIDITVAAIAQELTFIEIRQLRRALKNLKDNGLYEARYFSGTTKWKRVIERV